MQQRGALYFSLTRLLSAIPTLFLIIVMAFMMMHAAPGGPFDEERAMPPEIAANIARAYHLDEPLPIGQSDVVRVSRRVEEYWRRSGGSLADAAPERVQGLLEAQLEGVTDWDEFLRAPLSLDLDAIVPPPLREPLDALPTSIKLYGDRVPLSYELDQGVAVARLRLRDGKARRLSESDLPSLDRPLRFTVVRGKQEVLRANSLQELHAGLDRLPRHPRQHRSNRRHRGRR